MLVRVTAAQGIAQMLQEINPESKEYAMYGNSAAIAVENLLEPVTGFLDYVDLYGRLPGKTKRNRGGIS